MRINKLNPKQKIIIISLVFLLIIISMSLFFIKLHDNNNGTIGINNYNKYTANLPADRRDAINNTLYKIVENNSNSNNPSINDAAVRDNSVEDNYNNTTNIHSGFFIVDMKSIKQSYLISYKWSSDENNINLGGYTATASCLSLDKLLYGDFNCKDDFANSTNTTSRNPILDYLPYSTFNYTVTANNDSGKITLNVNIILYSSDTRNGQRDNSISKYKTEITDWIKSKKLSPDNYLMNYTINE
jgi:hypothetical protein